MGLALELAKQAANEGEVPVGAVVTFNNEVVGTGRNGREKNANALHHAEIEAINDACKRLGSWRLIDCNLYVTLEPCPMCAGAVINSRISKIIYGASDPKAGSCGSVINLFNLPYNHKPTIIAGVLKDECSQILISFFKNLRKTN